jgi:ribosomal protein S28E/S33
VKRSSASPVIDIIAGVATRVRTQIRCKILEGGDKRRLCAETSGPIRIVIFNVLRRA